MSNFDQFMHDDMHAAAVEANKGNYGSVPESMLPKNPHNFVPTDTEGHSMECTKCGCKISIHSPCDWDSQLLAECWEGTAYDIHDLPEEEKEAFRKAMDEYQDFYVPEGAETREDCIGI